MTGRWYMTASGSAVYSEHDCTADGARPVPASFRPVVVIDPENREQVERLDRLIGESLADGSHPRWFSSSDCLRAALREFASPPKPEEPLKGGSQVRERDGMIWTRVEGQPQKPWVYSGSDAAYASLDVVEVLR